MRYLRATGLNFIFSPLKISGRISHTEVVIFIIFVNWTDCNSCSVGSIAVSFNLAVLFDFIGSQAPTIGAIRIREINPFAATQREGRKASLSKLLIA